MKRASELKADIEKIKKLKALQQKATDKLGKIAGDSAVKPVKKKKAAPKKPVVKKKAKAAPKKKTKAPVKKQSFWQKLFGGKGGGEGGMRS
jgi:hypothetical protein